MRNIVYAYYLILLLSSFVAIRNFRVLNSTLKFLALLVIVTTVVELVAYHFAISQWNNLFVYVLFMPIQLILINLAYCHYHIGKIFRKIVICLTFVFLFFFFVFVTDYNFTVFPIKLMLTENLIIFCTIIFSSVLIINREQYTEIKKNNLIWINMGFVFFISTTFFIWGFHFLFKTKEINMISRFTLVISNIILYSSMAFTFFRAGSISERV